MEIERNKSLKHFNTFGIDVKAKEYLKIESESALQKALLAYKNKEIFILSGGSNMLLTRSIEKLVLHIVIKGITTHAKENDRILITAGAGENWHDFVRYCIENNYGGLENLSLIPGNVGSAPIQNIGAYGVELKDTFEYCDAIEIRSGHKKRFYKQDCHFGYRDSIFKNSVKGKYIITQVTFNLSTANHKIDAEYGAIQKALEDANCTYPTIKDISEAVIKIRKSKLPDPSEIGNSGSFFKNPVVTLEHFEKLTHAYPDMPFYLIDQQHYKIPAGWLIEKSGFKGKRYGDAGVHKNQALVLVNYGLATGQEILDLAEKIKNKIKKEFNILLETEVNII